MFIESSQGFNALNNTINFKNFKLPEGLIIIMFNDIKSKCILDYGI